jgi:hypothetical protein
MKIKFPKKEYEELKKDPFIDMSVYFLSIMEKDPTRRKHKVMKSKDDEVKLTNKRIKTLQYLKNDLIFTALVINSKNISNPEELKMWLKNLEKYFEIHLEDIPIAIQSIDKNRYLEQIILRLKDLDYKQARRVDFCYRLLYEMNLDNIKDKAGEYTNVDKEEIPILEDVWESLRAIDSRVIK